MFNEKHIGITEKIEKFAHRIGVNLDRDPEQIR